ncbi:MAG: hypothetical protein N2167_06575 [Flavobacteriales bacterium]|nr:hypothetical protein [Flavobacteriales bacterium]
MKSLSKTWLTDPLIDAEYKSYVLLDYLKNTQAAFEKLHLFPSLSELIEHYRELLALKDSSDMVRDLFPKQLVSINWKDKQLTYEQLINDISLMEEIINTLEFSIPKLKEQIEAGKEIYDEAESTIYMNIIGLMPLKTDEGYMLINTGKEVLAYQYQVTLYEQSETRYKGLRTILIQNYPWNISTTYVSIKHELIKQNNTLPNPATFAFECKKKLPLMECYLPIARRMLLQQLYVQ